MPSPPRAPASAASARRGSSCGWPRSDARRDVPDDDAVERGPARPPVPLHRVADDRRGRPPGLRGPTESVPRRAGRPSPPGAATSTLPRPPGRARGGRSPGRRRRTWRAAAAASPRTPPPPTRSWPCPTAAAAGRWASRSPRPGRWPSGSRGATPPWRCATPCRGPPGAWDLTLRTTFVEPGLPRARRVVVRARRRAGHAARQRRGLRRQAASPVAAAARRLADETRPGRARRVLARGRRALRAQASPDRRRRAGRRVRGAARGPHPGLARPRPAGRVPCRVGGARPGRARRWRCRARRSPPTCVARAGPRPPSCWPRSTAPGRGAVGPGSSRHGAVARRGQGHGHRRRRRGVRGLGGGGRGPRRGRAAVLRRGCGPPGAGLGAQRRRGRGRAGDRARPDHPVLRDPPGPRHAARSRSWWRTIPVRRCRRAIPSSPPSPRRRGWPPGFRRRGPWTWEVAREHSGRALLPGGARRALARVLGTDRRRAGRRRARARVAGGFEAQARKALANVAVAAVGTRGRLGPRGEDHGLPHRHGRLRHLQRHLRRGPRRAPAGPLGRRGRRACPWGRSSRSRPGPTAETDHAPAELGRAELTVPRCRGRTGSPPSAPSR